MYLMGNSYWSSIYLSRSTFVPVLLSLLTDLLYCVQAESLPFLLIFAVKYTPAPQVKVLDVVHEPRPFAY